MDTSWIKARFAAARSIAPGLTMAALIAMAAQFLSDHYGAPVMLMAILLGIPFHFMTEDPRMADGITFAARWLLRFGVALLGLRVSVGMVQAVGWEFLAFLVLAVAITIILSIATANLFGRERLFGFLTGGAVAICGASAAMAISSILPKRPESERDLVFTVISVTLLSTVAMILYPILASALGLSGHETGLFLGATIHDVAQVVGAGFSVSEETGELATLVKLLRVTLLAPVVLIGSLLLRGNVPAGAKRPPLLPGFVVVFLVLAALNSLQLVPDAVTAPAAKLSSAALVTAVAAVGMKTSLAQLRDVGASSTAMIAGQTVFLAGMVLAGLWVLG